MVVWTTKQALSWPAAGPEHAAVCYSRREPWVDWPPAIPAGQPQCDVQAPAHHTQKHCCSQQTWVVFLSRGIGVAHVLMPLRFRLTHECNRPSVCVRWLGWLVALVPAWICYAFVQRRHINPAKVFRRCVSPGTQAATGGCDQVCLCTVFVGSLTPSWWLGVPPCVEGAGLGVRPGRVPTTIQGCCTTKTTGWSEACCEGCWQYPEAGAAGRLAWLNHVYD